MCGITGVLGGRDPLSLARRMNGCLAHRGPDDEGSCLLPAGEGEVAGALAQRRLAIIDVSAAGHQPMWSRNRRYAIVYNGEIYNYRELRRELEASGQEFVSGSDTEVLLYGLARHGHAFVGRLRGMFAFVFWDSVKARALLARDPFGIKPLYLAVGDGQVAFASELRALRTGGLVSTRIDGPAVSGYLAWGSVPEPLAMLAGVVVHEAGSVLEVRVAHGRAGHPTLVTRYNPFQPGTIEPGRMSGSVRDPEAAASLVREAVQDSVKHHLIADVPVAVFLSGGIDSSVVCALAAASSPQPLDSFTVVFDDPAFSEATFARAASDRFGTRHHEIVLTGEDFYRALDPAFAAMDQPSMDGLNTYVVSRAVRSAGIKVVLSGLGGDELFAGYPSFARAVRLSRWWPVVRVAGLPLRHFSGTGIAAGKLASIAASHTPALAAYRVSRMLFPPDFVRLLTGRAPSLPIASEPFAMSPLQQVTWHELTGYMRNTLLRDSDVFAMASGLELRVPFVDREVVATSLALHDSVKIRPGTSKPLLVDAMRDLLPREVWDRTKRGFALPFDAWMRGPLRAAVDAALTDRTRIERVGLEPAAARMVWEGFLAGKGAMTWSRPWALYTLVRWAEEVNAVSGLDDVPLVAAHSA